MLEKEEWRRCTYTRNAASLYQVRVRVRVRARARARVRVRVRVRG